MFSFISKLNRKQLFIIVLILFFIPFPTQSVPEWKIQVVNEQNQPLHNVRLLQYWDNYTYWGYKDKRENTYSDENGYATFSPKYIWASLLSRITFPPIAFLSQFAHGSAGTHSYVRIIDENYETKFTESWRDKEIIYFRFPKSLPEKIVTKRLESKSENTGTNKTEGNSGKNIQPVGNLKID